MRVGIDITPVTAAPTGVGYYVRHLLRELAVLMPADRLRGLAICLRRLDKTSIPMAYTRIPVPTRLMHRFWEYGRWPCADVLLGGVDVYHAVNYVLPPLKAARGVLSIHDLGFLHNPDWSHPAAANAFRRTIQVHAARSHAIIACSHATARDIAARLDVDPSRIHIIYDAADDVFAPMDPEAAGRQVYDALGVHGPYLLFVSTVEPRKNVNGLLSAFARTSLPHKLVIAGGMGWRSNEILAHASQLNLEERVVFTGYLPNRSLFPALYSAADAFVFPSWHEGFGLTVLEALSCGCPVITSNTSALPEVGGEAAVYVDPGDVEGLARKMEEVVADASLRSAMRTKGLEHARKFSWRKCAEETIACYRSVP